MMPKGPLRQSLLAAACLLLVVVVYLPGIHGAWLFDDFNNLGLFSHYKAGAAPYAEIIFHNQSGPLGRSVAMASFAANHVLDLFSTADLKTTNILIHAGNGILLFFLTAALLAQRPPGSRTSPRLLAALVACWWMLLPIHISAVLYIVQRMTLLAAGFSLASMLAYVNGRRALQAGDKHRGALLIGLSLLVLFPLALLSKESALTLPASLILIELFFFSRLPAGPLTLPRLLTLLVLATALLGAVLVVALHLGETFALRDFSLQERLLTEGRVIWSYVRNIFLPDSQQMGLQHDDYPISRDLFQPWTTLPALVALAALLAVSVRASVTRWWALSFGILFYLAGQLIESTVFSLELYFEHRNYLPSAGLILAASVALTELLPLRRMLIAGIMAAYLTMLAFSTLERARIWGDESLLMATYALNHPHSVRAWADYAENLFDTHHGNDALQASLQGARNNPEAAGIFFLQMASIYCRSDQAPPPELIRQMATALASLPDDRPSLLVPLSIGLDFILTRKAGGHCGDADFSPLAPALVARENALRARFGPDRTDLWLLRMTMAEWLLNLGHREDALRILRDTWNQGNQPDIPMVGLTLAKALDKSGNLSELRTVLAQLAAVTADAPPDFRAEMTALQARLQEKP